MFAYVYIQAGGCGSSPSKVMNFLSPTATRPALGPSSLLSNGYRDSFSEVQRPGREAYRSPPSSAEVKKGGTPPPLPTSLLGNLPFLSTCTSTNKSCLVIEADSF
jgi:hypothetical protein